MRLKINVYNFIITGLRIINSVNTMLWSDRVYGKSYDR